jgi:hypothetical protein
MFLRGLILEDLLQDGCPLKMHLHMILSGKMIKDLFHSFSFYEPSQNPWVPFYP